MSAFAATVHSQGPRGLIIVADDFGYSRERDDGIIDAARRGIVCAASLLVTGVSAASALARARELSELGVKLDVGVHLNLTEGSPVSDPASVPSLVHDVTKRPFFRGKFGLRQALAAGIIDLADVEREIRAQLRRFKGLCSSSHSPSDAATPLADAPSHCDGHQHVHVHPAIAPVFARVLQEEGIRVTRLPVMWDAVERLQAASEPSAGASVVGMPPARLEFYREVSVHALAAAVIFDAHGLVYYNFVGFASMGTDATVPRLLSMLQRAATAVLPHPRPVIEWMTHIGCAAKPSVRVHASPRCECDGTCARPPSCACDLTLTCTCDRKCPHACACVCKLQHTAGVGEGPDSFALSFDRDHELAVWTDAAVKRAIDDISLRLQRFSDVA